MGVQHLLVSPLIASPGCQIFVLKGYYRGLGKRQVSIRLHHKTGPLILLSLPVDSNLVVISSSFPPDRTSQTGRFGRLTAARQALVGPVESVTLSGLFRV